ncbi:helix-hairpin-helix domain-containing protein [uncultured Acetobacteroides sp.]|uniref:helix-hairpin-helix domain-containing protein n=1 Tax=uncultured Acetobacteroides sp. TaxID=1760811 RepID=UPI0029F5C9FB|nr:helix-hairpin-helix domain-containing protein [uncultured Acetobacteroides sp.]
MRRILYLICFSTSITTTQAQVTSHDPVKQIVEYVLNINTDSPSDVEELSNHFEALRSTPICINQPTAQHLEKLLVLSDFQIESITEYVAANGEIKSLNELQYVPGFDTELSELIVPFITLTIPEKKHITLADLQKIRSNYMVRSSYTIQNSRGFNDTSSTHFLGKKSQYALASNISLGKSIFINIHSEKDAGERATINRAYFDSFGGSVMAVEPIKHVSRLIVGDYRINLGQGLLSWSGFSTSKSSDPTLLRRKSSINTFKSFDEINFYRGAAIEVNYKPISIVVAASKRWLDGHPSTTDSLGIVIPTSGLHRNSKELLSRSAVQQQMLASRVSYTYKQSVISLNLFSKETNVSTLSSSEQGASIDFYGKWGKYSTFGEVAVDQNKNIATFIGTTIKLSYQTLLTASYRKYPKSFSIKSNNSFGESSNATNEEGVYLGIKISPRYKYSVLAYVDMFQSPAPKYRVSKPSDGTEAGISLSGIIGSSIESRIRFRYKTKEMDIPQPSGNYALTERVKSYKGDANLRYVPDKKIEFRLSGAISYYATESQSSKLGYLTYADFQFNFDRLPIRLYTRFATFDAPTWDVALYCYENDLPGMYASSSFHQKGSRTYLMLRAKLGKQLSLWLKIAETFYSSTKASIGDGVDKINGNRKTDVRLQATLDL